MTKQETFDLAARHLLSMQIRSYDEERDLCAYRGPNGAMCAVGALIPDELYDPEMEGHSAHSIEVEPVLMQLGHDVQLCGDLQKIHDDYFLERHEALVRVAQQYGLFLDVLSERERGV